MMTRFDITCGSDYYKMDIIISEGTVKYKMKEPIQIDPKRLVLPFSMLIVLMYVVSLNIQPSIKLNIHNQCLNVDLISPTYITHHRLECHRPPDYKVCAGNTTKSGFIIESGYASYGILIYRLQKKQSHESNEIDKGTASAAHLLVVWKFSKFNELYADVLLARYDKRFNWDRDDLEFLYNKNDSQFRLCPDSATETWLLDDNTVLITAFKIMNEDHILDITVSEVEGDNGTWMPVHVNLKR
jgi:hypothetical protein